MSAMELRRAALVVVMCVGLVGCQVSTAPKQVAQWDQHHAVSVARAPWSGQYNLFASEPKGQRRAIGSVHLKKGEELGFRQRETGVVAVAGALEIPLTQGQYEWEMTPDKGQTDPFATTILIVVIVLAVLVIVVFLISLDVAAHPL